MSLGMSRGLLFGSGGGPQSSGLVGFSACWFVRFLTFVVWFGMASPLSLPACGERPGVSLLLSLMLLVYSDN